MFLINQIFLNLFVAIVVDSFLSQTQAIDLPVQPRDIEMFVETWKDFDNEAKGHICCHKIQPFIDKLIDKKCGLLPPSLTKRPPIDKLTQQDQTLEEEKF